MSFLIIMVGKLVKNTTNSCIWLKTGMICMSWLPLHVIPLMTGTVIFLLVNMSTLCSGHESR